MNSDGMHPGGSTSQKKPRHVVYSITSDGMYPGVSTSQKKPRHIVYSMDCDSMYPGGSTSQTKPRHVSLSMVVLSQNKASHVVSWLWRYTMVLTSKMMMPAKLTSMEKLDWILAYLKSIWKRNSNFFPKCNYQYHQQNNLFSSYDW